MGPFSRRDALRGGRDLAALLSLSTLAGVESPFVAPADAAQDARHAVPDVYRSIGVKPLVNARGTFTIISGSLMLPEVRAAMDAAARHYVHLDELTDAIGARLATLTGAEWGLVTVGMLGGADTRNRGVHRRRQSRASRADAEPDGLSRKTKSSSRGIRATSTMRPSGRSARASSR